MKQPFEWQWNFKVLLFSAVFFPLTISLGFWQLERAEEKRDIVAAHQARSMAGFVPLSQVMDTDQQYVKVSVEASVVDTAPTLLLDNRVRNGRPGYEVLNVVETVTGKKLLVNRGWLEGSLDRRTLPEVQALSGEFSLQGYLYRSPGKQLMLGEDNWSPVGVLEVIQNAAPEKVAERLEVDLYPYTLRLDRHSKGALQTDWVIVNVQPGKHTGYAVQWFAMAIILLVMTVFANSNLGQVWQKTK